MMHCAKNVFIAWALLCPAVLAADCGEANACGIEQDETSLVQVRQKLTHGTERIPNNAGLWDTPEHDDAAVADSEPAGLDDGEVIDAFATNTDKVRAKIEKAAAKSIDFANKERVARKTSHEKAAQKVAADKKSVAIAVAFHKAAVDEALAARKQVIDRADQKVKKAKEQAIAHKIKAAQAEHAAALGRRVGTIEGKDAARHAWADYKADVKNAKEVRARAAAREKIAAHEAAEEAAVKKKTAALKAADDAWVARADRAASLAKARAAAEAAREENRIEGPEALRNRMTDTEADWSVKHYDRITKSGQKRVDAAAAGDYPAGDWPVGPGDAPDSLALIDSEIPNEAAGWSTPRTNWAAIVESMPDHLDHGSVMDSFAVNVGKVKDEIQAKAADRIVFTNKNRAERKMSHEEAAAAVAADKASVAAAVAKDKAAVDETTAMRKHVVDHAAQRVKDAKENAMAHTIKAKQAEYAAALGRRVGNMEGADAARHAWADYRSDVTAEKKAEARAAARAKIAAHEAAVRAAVEKKTAAEAAANDARVAKADRAAAFAKAKAAAEERVQETRIEGPEGLTNRMTEEKADWAVKHYNRIANAAQNRIAASASGNYPAGDWPAGPGDAPGLDGSDLLYADAAAWGQ